MGAPLVVDADVAAIIEWDTTIPLAPFIGLAHHIVEEELSGFSYSADRLKEIERWLSAHFYAVRDPRAGSESAGVSQSYALGSLGMKLDFTQWGQMATALDTSGTLAQMTKTSGSVQGSVEVVVDI